ncbi:GntR family transcriptional regulator [Mycobacterium avium subsp. hominissuis 10-5606]|nr:GntR family transcriptional regulator [Mycobacterium avium subsp. hominissuis 10-5606]
MNISWESQVSDVVNAPESARTVAEALRRMIADGRLKDGDDLPDETGLMLHFGVDHSVIRDAIRILETEGVVEMGPNAERGAQRGEAEPETVAGPSALLLDLAGATIADVLTTRAGIEPLAARLLAESNNDYALNEIEGLITVDVPAGWRSGDLAETTARFHRRLVELSGNETLAMIAGMLHDITVRHTAAAIGRARPVPESEYDKLSRSYQRLLKLLRAHDGPGAEAHWRRHMDTARGIMVRGYENAKVRDMR